MTKLADALAALAKDSMAREILSLSGASRECRAVFCGPPPDLLREVFELLAGDGRLLAAATADGTEISYPIVLQVDEPPADLPTAEPDRSGACLFNKLATIRNARNGTFLTLVPPGGQASDTHDSTRKSFGVAPAAYEGGAPISIWWMDPFIQQLVDQALGDGEAGQLEEAKQLVFEAVVAADAADQHAVSRPGAWGILKKLWELRDSRESLDLQVSLATSFPPSGDGRVDAARKESVLQSLVEKFERSNLGTGIEQLKTRARDDQESAHLDAFLAHIRRKCDVVTALKRSMPYFYAPDDIAPAPDWWRALTVQRWEELLDDDDISDPPPPDLAALEISCTNPLAFPVKGFVPLVGDVARMRVQLPEGWDSQIVRVVRQAPGGAANRREWTLSGGLVLEFEDDAIPEHKTPVRYTAEAVGLDAKKAAVKVISLRTWEPGLIVCSRTATKGKVPQHKRGAIETTLEMSGPGRHYLDIYVRPGVEIRSDEAQGSNEAGELDAGCIARISPVRDDEFGIEVEAGGERFYQFEIKRPAADRAEKFRIHLLADEAAAEECLSYFEYYLARNSKRDGGRLPRTIHANTQARSAQLQGWMLDDSCVARSYYPFVLAPDYATHWRRREWTSADDTIFSAGRFLNDPRPAFDEMQPPEAFLAARRAIAAKVRGEEGSDLLESANLGDWVVTDQEFASQVDAYVRSYLDWLTSVPEVACWCDIGLVLGLENDGATLQQEPDAIVVSPLHPVRLAWQCIAQRAMYLASRKLPCPAASVMDPDCVPDAIALPLRNPTGGTNETVYFSVECSSDYWGILWNTNRLDRLGKADAKAPLDREMGLLVGGISSGFSVSQVHRAMEDVCEMLVAKPVIGVMVSSAAGQNNACNEGILSWGRKHFATDVDSGRIMSSIGASEVHIFDERREEARPDDAEVSNLAEDTSNAIQWYAGTQPADSPDLAIIAQLETSNASAEPTKLASPLGVGGLVRVRIREQQKAGSGQFLCESRVAAPVRASGDGIADNTAKAIAALENLAATRLGYVFAPSMHAVKKSLEKAEFAAVSSSAVDPACFLGNWLEGTYLWDYELPSYSGRSGDSNGYYLLSQIKELDLEVLKIVLQRLPGCDALSDEQLSEIVQEVARRGIPTVRGLSAGNSGAAGDLGLLVATRLLQDCFRPSAEAGGLLEPWTEADGEQQVNLIIPVDPFQCYLDDLAKAIKKPTMHRPDLMVVSLAITDSKVRCKLTPIEVKNRSGARMTTPARSDALGQAKSLSSLLQALTQTFTEDAEMLLWRLGYQNLLATMIGYGFRVYSQHLAQSGRSAEWSRLHSRVIEAILSSELDVHIDARGRLVVIDGSPTSGASDTDGDGFRETIELTQTDAGLVVLGAAGTLFQSIKEQLLDWALLPQAGSPDASGAPGSALLHADVPPVPEAPSEGQASVPEPDLGDGTSDETTSPRVAVAPPPAGVEPLVDGAVQTGLVLRVGETLDGFQKHVRRLNLGQTSLNQLNMGVVGDLGTGKTQLLKSLVYQIATGEGGNRGVKPNVLIFDYKKDYSTDDFVQAVGARVIRPQHLPLNLFDLSGASQSINPKLDRYRFFADAIDKIYAGIGPVQRDRLKTAVKDAYAALPQGKYPTIHDVQQNYSSALKGGADALSGILGDLVDMELFAEDSSAIASPADFLKGVVVISLNELGQDDRTKNMLVAIMLNVFYEHMLRIPKRPFLGANGDMRVVDSMLLVDEADNIMKYEFDVLRKILLQGREFGVGVILASQYLSHFKAGATDYREPLLTWFLHKVPSLKPQELGALGLSDASNLPQLAERIKTLGLHECLYKTHDVSGEFIKGAPFYQRGEWGQPK